ncbi:MAG: hypothetical protein KGI08_05865 [Thaumarchaeota archaeon]|nr:hypothetical protein [Nitrososphaerota archaeon]
MKVTTGFGYFKDAQGRVICKYEFPLGEHPDPADRLIPVEVADKETLDAIQIYVAPRSPQDAFDVNQFVQDLLGAFASDNNVLQYYAAVKDLATFKNFSGMKAIINALLAAGKLTQTEVDTLNTVLAKQNIVLTNF